MRREAADSRRIRRRKEDLLPCRPTRWRPRFSARYGSAWLEPISEPLAFTSITPLASGAEVRLDPEQTNYLVNVLRLGAGARVLLFNGRDGEFSASLAARSRKAASLVVGARTRARRRRPTSIYLFAPLKHARLDYMAQKAVEMGAGACVRSSRAAPRSPG